MSWFRVEPSVRTHPKIHKLARRLGVPFPHALGLMTSLWAWVTETAADGDLGSYDCEDISFAAQWDGDPKAFETALLEVRLLDRTEHGLAVHDWDERAERYERSKKEAERRQKKRSRRHGGATVDPQWCHGGADGEDGRTDGHDGEDGRTDGRLLCSELALVAPPSEPEAQVMLVFPTNGKIQSWALSDIDVGKWSKLFPNLDILNQCQRALAWIEANPDRRKTAKGMPRFLVNWFGRATDRGGRFSENRSEQIKKALNEWDIEQEKRGN